MKKTRLTLLAAASLLLPLGAGAQPNGGQPTDIARRVKAQRESRLTSPLLTMQRPLTPRPQPSAGIQTPLTGQRLAVPSPFKAEGSTMFWCNLVYSSKWTDYNYGPFGYYSFRTESPVSFNLLAETQPNNVATNGVQVKDGKIYGVYLDSRYSSEGYTYVYLSTTDLSTGATTTADLGVSHLNLAATETAQATDGTVYGVFYSADGQSLEWGTADYSTLTRTTIGPASQAFIAIGITSEGQLYGIGMDGSLYSVDKSTGVETLIGETGLTLRNDYGQYYGQSGEIDPKDNTFYWYAIDSSTRGGLYKVSLESGDATQIDNTLAQVQGIVMPLPEANDGAPAKATGLAADFQGASLTGTVSFTAPKLTYDGSTLSGALDYKVSSNDVALASGKAQPGEAVRAQVAVPTNGSYTFTVTTSNAEGESPKEAVSRWVGYDQPQPPTAVTATASGRSVSVAWTAPTASVHGGTMGSLTYDVARIHDYDTVTVARDLTQTSYQDRITQGALANYVYAVTAKAAGVKSQPAHSNGVVVGDAIEPDWSTDFPSYSAFSLFSVIDANGDNQRWTYFNAGGQQLALGPYSNDNGNDDWLFTPPIHLQTGRLYLLKFKARNYIAPYYMNTFEVKYGQEATPSGMAIGLMPTSELPGDPQAVYTYELNAPADGTYFVGFHDNTVKAGSGRLVIDSIGIESGPMFSSPDSVTNVKVTPATQGGLSAQLSFTAPTKTIGGDALSRIGYIQIKRDGKAITYMGNAVTVFVNAGERLTFTDENVPASGMHTYEFIPYEEAGYEAGRAVKATVFIGNDVAYGPDVTLTDNETDIRASWDAFGQTGIHGGYVNPQHVAVSLYELDLVDGGAALGDFVVSSEQGATHVNVPWDPEATTNEDQQTQALYQLAACAVSDGGRSEVTATTPVVVGLSIEAPYRESFEGARLDNGFAWTESNGQHASRWNAALWRIDRRAASDDDGGGMIWANYNIPDPDDPEYYSIMQGDESSFNLPKVTIQGVDDPVLKFDLYAIAGEQARLSVRVQKPSGEEVELQDINLAEVKTTGWSQQAISLEPYIDERYVIVKFRGISQGNYTYMCIDNIHIFDQSQADGIGLAEMDGGDGSDVVMTLDGRIVSTNGKGLNQLPKGIYIVGGHKRVVK